MTTGVKWIKFMIGTFEGYSFKKIKRAKIGGVSYRDKLTAVWFELLELAGKVNNNGFLTDTNGVPFKDYEEIAIAVDREEKEIELCMEFYLKEQMLEIIDEMYCITKFSEIQNIEGLEKIKEQNRIRKQRQRENKKLLNMSNKDSHALCHVMSRDSHALEEDKDIKKEDIKKKDIKKKDIKKKDTYTDITNVCISSEEQFDIYSRKYYKDEEVNDLFVKFLEMRISLNRPVTLILISSICKEIVNVSDKIKKRIIERSLSNKWYNLYVQSYDITASKDKTTSDWVENRDIEEGVEYL